MNARIAPEGEVIDIVDVGPDRVETCSDRKSREATEVLDAVEAFLSDRELDAPVHQDRSRRVAMEEVYAEYYRQSAPRSVRLWGATVPAAAAAATAATFHDILGVVRGGAALRIEWEVEAPVVVVVDPVIA